MKVVEIGVIPNAGESKYSLIERIYLNEEVNAFNERLREALLKIDNIVAELAGSIGPVYNPNYDCFIAGNLGTYLLNGEFPDIQIPEEMKQDMIAKRVYAVMKGVTE